MDEIELQRNYYASTSKEFDRMHLKAGEHVLACHLLVAFLKARYPDATILDIGAGTGRLFQFFCEQNLGFSIVGIEPSAAQRSIAYNKGIRPDRLIEGDATKLDFSDDHFDFCTEFGVLHHIKNSRQAVREMCRVASTGVFLSDSNNFGQGSFSVRVAKYLLRTCGLWKVADFMKTGGKGYNYSEGDGVIYSFTVLDCVEILKQKFPQVYIWNTRPLKSKNLLFGADHVVILAHR
jgi:ubiquinone/menaquinone biosynthesis C-methylase UbiE